MEINVNSAKKVLKTVDAGLSSGVGNPVPGQMCVEAAVCYGLGLPHGDNPVCVAPALRKLKIRLNDSIWSSKEARAAGLRRLALVQLGSAGVLDEKEFARRVAILAIKISVPEALRAAAALMKNNHKDKLLNIADLCEKEPTVKSAKAAYAAANAATYAATCAANAANSAANAANSAASAATYAATCAANAANSAANAATYAADAAYAAANAANSAANAAKNRDKSLSKFAEAVVQILIEMKAPGAQWLYLTE